MLGTGRATVAQIADLARAAVSDGLPLEAVKAFASLGGEGKHPSNQERDLHNWLKRLFGFELETYNVLMDVNASRTQQLCFLRQYISLTSSLAPAFPFTSCCYPCLSLSRSLVLSALSLCLSISSLSLSLLSLRTFVPLTIFSVSVRLNTRKTPRQWRFRSSFRTSFCIACTTQAVSRPGDDKQVPWCSYQKT